MIHRDNIIPFPTAYDRAVSQTLADCAPLFLAASNGMALLPAPVQPQHNDIELIDGIPEDMA